MVEDRHDLIREKLQEIKKVIDQLWEIADEDDKITQDERELIELISSDIKDYEDLVDQILSKPEITDSEVAKLHSLEKRIIQDASSQSYMDGVVTEEEENILRKLISLFEEMND